MNAGSMIIGLLFVVAGGAVVIADDVTRDSGKALPDVDHSVNSPGSKTTAIVYTPPVRGAPRTRVGGATRGDNEDASIVAVVAPDHTGYTGEAQPTLYWYLSRRMTARIEVAVINDQEIDPVMETVLDSGAQPGINRLSLQEHGVTLLPGVLYQWSVAVVNDPGRRSGDVVASGRIRLVVVPGKLAAELAAAAAYQRAIIYARAGYWYDAFDQLSRLIAGNPGNPDLVRERVSLLNQVGLEAIAAAQSKRTDRLK